MKKKYDEIEEEMIPETPEEVAKARVFSHIAETKHKKITCIEHDFGREDLNELRDKVNELIALNS